MRESAPGLLPFVHSAYEKSSFLFCCVNILQSAEGVQQGGPLGPLLFCLAIHPTACKLKSEYKLFYLDDGTMGGSLPTILHDLRLVESMALDVGLELNCHKSELTRDDQASREAMLVEVPNQHLVSGGCANLLGSPSGVLESIDKVLREKAIQLQLMGGRLPHLHSHDALLLLRHSFTIPKLIYIMRTSPCFLSAELEVYDNLLKTILCDVINVRLDEVSWSQACLPIRFGGIGVRRVAQLATSFLASAACCSDLIRLILPLHLQNVSYPPQESALASWQCGHNEPHLLAWPLIARRSGIVQGFKRPISLIWMICLIPVLKRAC